MTQFDSIKKITRHKHLFINNNYSDKIQVIILLENKNL